MISTHPFQPLDLTLPPPSNDWNRPFAALAAECRIAVDCAVAFATVAEFYAALKIGDGL